MTAIWALTAQSFMVFLGYCAAVTAGGSFAAVAASNFGPNGFVGDANELIQMSLLAVTLALGAIPHSIVPAAIIVALTEGFRLRGVTAYLTLGAAAGLLVVIPIGAVIAGLPLPPMDGAAVRLSVASGAVGGFVYWLIAGRTAGRWTELPWFERNRR